MTAVGLSSDGASESTVFFNEVVNQGSHRTIVHSAHDGQCKHKSMLTGDEDK